MSGIIFECLGECARVKLSKQIPKNSAAHPVFFWSAFSGVKFVHIVWRFRPAGTMCPVEV